jgi:cold shock CspA family protein
MVGVLYRKAGTPQEIKDQCSKVIELAPPTSTPKPTSFISGQVCSWRGTYGFIAHPSHPSNVFFHLSTVQDGVSPHVGDNVRFDIATDNQGRVRATWVQVLQ